MNSTGDSGWSLRILQELGLFCEAKIGLQAFGRFVQAPETGSRNGRSMLEEKTNVGYRGHGQVASEGRKRCVNMLNMLNEKGFWEGGVIPNTYSDVRSIANFQEAISLKP